jgi:sigma-B regulation protein RsbU (phosphoserine phosphatase)
MIEEAFDKGPGGYFSFFDNGIISLVNETCCSLLGYDKQELAEKNVETIFTLPTRIFYQTHFFPLVKMQGYAEEIFLSLLTKDGVHLPVLLNAKRIETDKGACIACVFIVVTNRKKFEDELVAARKEAEAALRENTSLLEAKADLQRHTEKLDTQIHVVNQQNHELKQLNHVITHSLKEPVRKILLFADKLKEDLLPGLAHNNLSRLTRATIQMRSIVLGLQQYVWLNDAPVSLQMLNLEEAVKKAEEKLREELKENELELQTGPLPAIEADAAQIELLLYHLLSNSVRFKKGEKAVVTIKASIVQQNRFTNVEGKYQYGDFVKLEVIDEGTGFDPVHTISVFELFKKLQPNEGIGLGLALCKKITENHFGQISAESSPGKGTIIIIILPVSHAFHALKQAEPVL